MNLYERTVAQIEMKTPYRYYRATYKGISEKGKLNVDRYLLSEDPRFLKLKGVQQYDYKNQRMDKQREEALTFDYIYYYKDANESEETRVETVQIQAINSMKMNHSWIDYGKDYEVVVECLEDLI